MAAKLHFLYGSMGTGKSTALLQVAFNYSSGNLKVRVFTAAIDDRTQVGAITSRLGTSRPAEIFYSNTKSDTNFIDLLKDEVDLRCVLIDEAQFLSTEQVIQLHKLAALHDIPVMCFGLRADFRGEPFEGSARLLALAEELKEIKAICTCGKKSTMNMRIDESGRKVTEGSQILIGGDSKYRQVCARCFYTNG